jgi:hypothetical protein
MRPSHKEQHMMKLKRSKRKSTRRMQGCQWLLAMP